FFYWVPPLFSFPILTMPFGDLQHLTPPAVCLIKGPMFNSIILFSIASRPDEGRITLESLYFKCNVSPIKKVSLQTAILVIYIYISIYLEDEGDGGIMEPVLELNGCAEANPPHYLGIPFPPPVPAPQASAHVLEEIISRKETLENRLVTWVEQEIMAQIISEMQGVRAPPDISLSSSESPSSAASDMVEAAGGKGLQLFVDAGVPVDSGLVRSLVDEALADMVAVMLGDRAAHRAPPQAEADYQVTVPLVPTPQDTPPASPPLSSRETCLVKTPAVSPEPSLAEPLSHIEDADQVAQFTPPITPPASSPRVATPPVSERHEDQADSPVTSLYNPWSHQELPLDEENPYSLREVVQYKDAIVMTVTKEEEPESLVSGPSTEPENVSFTPPRSPPSLPSSEASTQQSSLTVTFTETESLDRPISEGEIFYNPGQIPAARGNSYSPNLCGIISCLEYDPPSEGQVIPRTLRGAYRDPILSALANLNQDPVAPQAGSDDEDSVGEISEGQRPSLTTAAEQVLMGRSAYVGRPSNTTATSTIQRERPSSPGLCQGGPGQNTPKLRPVCLNIFMTWCRAHSIQCVHSFMQHP
uniref:Uncharacterized protein n=1 Tax=Leptobrachium leishanense TaxID=445787 RepID=A0A8C5QXH7_9ANUR